MIFSACGGGDEIVVFTLEDDRLLGNNVRERIETDTAFVVVSRDEFASAYNYVEDIFQEILASDDIIYGPDTAIFDWNITLLDDDNLLSAFNAPGGQLFIYTGLLFFLDKEEDLAGLMSYEVSHVDQRHTSRNLQRVYGISSLKNVASGNQQEALDAIITQISGGDPNFTYNRSDKGIADTLSVKYLADSQFACNGFVDTFAKLIRFQEQRDTPFLDLHGNDENRIEGINTFANNLPCNTEVGNESFSRYQAFRNSLP